MLRLFLIHLGRFLRCYLVACFGSVLFVPLLFNLYDVITQNGYRDNVMYLCAALVPAVIATYYTLQQRRRVNSDEVRFFVSTRLRLHPKILVPYFELTGVLLRTAAGFDLAARQRAFLAALHLADTIEREALAAQAAANAAAMGLGDFGCVHELGAVNELRLDQLAQAAAQSAALSCIETVVAESHLTAKRRNLERSKAALLRGLSPETSLEPVLSQLVTALRGYGSYLEAWVFVSLLRSLMNALPAVRDYQTLSALPALQQVATQLLVSTTAQRSVARYLFLLNHEVAQLRQRAAALQAQYEQAQAAARAHHNWRHEQAQDSTGFGFHSHFEEQTASAYEHAADEPHECNERADESDYERDDEGDYERAEERREELSAVQRAYQILGVPADAPLSVIKTQYRRLAFRYHPDHIKDYLSLSPAQQRALNAKFQEICAAYSTIVKARNG